MPIISETSTSLTCPFCSVEIPICSTTVSEKYPGFYHANNSTDKSSLKVIFIQCPTCKKLTISIEGNGTSTLGHEVLFSPTSMARQYPSYIPQQIRNDYEEAYKILHLSPKASATLSRRCLQGIIRDFWGISERTLNAEITFLKDKIDPSLWNAINSIRSIGNIGAHMESDINLIIDIDPDEAERLIKLLEMLFKEFYIARHERDKLLADITSIGEDKESQRNN